MRIGTPSVHRHGVDWSFEVEVESAAGPGALFYRVSPGLPAPEVSCDAPLSALLIPAMFHGEDIEVTGPVSGRLLHNARGPLQAVLRLMIPGLHPVAIRAHETALPTLRAPGVATGFSAGIDSFCLLADYFYADLPPEMKVTHLLFNNVGSHYPGGESLFRERRARVAPVAERMGLPLIGVHSNVDRFYPKALKFERTHTLRNASVALLLQSGVGRYLYASAYHYGDLRVFETGTMARADPMLLGLLTTDRLDALSVGSEYTRVQKTLRVAEVEDSYSSLDVCAMPDTPGRANCSVCWKCLRTLATLEVAGLLERYAGVFDLEAYRARREPYLRELQTKTDPLSREILAFAEERGFPLRPAGGWFARLAGAGRIENWRGRALARLGTRA